MNKIRYTLLIGSLFLALVLSALNSAPVLADDSAPPAETTEETSTPQDSAQQTEDEVATSSEETVAETESTVPAEEAPQTSGEADSAPAEESISTEQILEQLPTDTQIVVLDEEGQSVSLATQDADDAIALGDPRWCPAGAVPPAGCSPSFSKFVGTGGLLEWLSINNPAKAGTIWIEANYDSAVNEDVSTPDIVIDGTVFTYMANYALTINGGWSGSNNANLSATDLSEFRVPFSIVNWNAPVTINNIAVTGATGADYALTVGTNGDIVIKNVDVSNNTTTIGGASLTNNLASKAANVTITDGDFNNNAGKGLDVVSNGVVTLKNINANDNDDEGASIDNTFATKALAVTLTGTNNFKFNGTDGLVIFSKGLITTNYLTASNNGNHGVYLDNCAMDVLSDLCTNTFASGVTIKGYNHFSNNGWDGLRVYSNGVITASNLTANDNGTDGSRPHYSAMDKNYETYGKGVYLDNSGALTAKRGVTMNGINTFNNNASTGLFIVSKGLMTLSNLTANRNLCDAAKEDSNFYCAGVYLYSYGGVTHTGYGSFNENQQYGLRITTFNTSVTLTSLTAEHNLNNGIHIDGGISSLPANITLNGYNYTNNNVIGTWLKTNGAVTVNNLTSKLNLDSGLYIDNTLAVSARPVTLKGVNIFEENAATGVTINSRGAVTTYSITAVSNQGAGVVIDNCDENSGVCDAYTTTVKTVSGGKTITTIVYQAVSVLGVNYLYDNAGDGLTINSRGGITVSNITSVANTNNGVSLRNDYNNAVGNVAFTGTNNISYNTGRGIEVTSRGSVVLNNVTANYNTLKGAEISNNLNSAKPVNVTVNGTNRFNGNGETGLFIETYGVVTLSNITASDNGNPDPVNGVYVNNANGTIAKAVTVSGVNVFNNNYGTGLDIESKGAVTLSKITANFNKNGGNGVRVRNVLTVGTQPVKVTTGIFLSNDSVGLQIESSGTVTITTITSNDNGSHGVSIDTHYDSKPTTVANVVVSGTNFFNHNGANGIFIRSDGAITLTNIFANGNDINGAELDNFTYADGASNQAITFNGINNLSNNANNGLDFLSNGAVTLTRFTADNNRDTGLFSGSGVVGILAGTGKKTFTVSCGSALGNELNGFSITGATAITLKGVQSWQTNDFNITPVQTRSCPLP